MQRNDRTEPAGTIGRHGAWPVEMLVAVGAWLVVSPLVLATTSLWEFGDGVDSGPGLVPIARWT